jgi:hypothetical protein
MTDAIKRYSMFCTRDRFVEPVEDKAGAYTLASDHEREVAGLRDKLESWYKAEREFYGIEKLPGDTDRQSAVERLKADRDALQKRCGELETLLRHLWKGWLSPESREAIEALVKP